MGVQREVDGKRQALDRCEHELGACTWELDALRQSPDHELRLPARPELRLDPQRPTAVLDVAIHPAQDIALERRKHCLSVAFEGERSRLVPDIEERLPQRPAERPAYEPLHLHAPGLADRKHVPKARVGLIGSHPPPLRRRESYRTPVTV